MTAFTVAVLVVCTAVLLAALAWWARRRLAAAECQRIALEAFRAALGIPAGRFRVVDVSLAESVCRGLRPWARFPRFQDVYRVDPDPAVQADLLAAVFADPSRGERR